MNVGTSDGTFPFSSQMACHTMHGMSKWTHLARAIIYHNEMEMIKQSERAITLQSSYYEADRIVGNAPHSLGTPNTVRSPNAVEARKQYYVTKTADRFAP